MIVSFHPCFEADINILCAGRDPDRNDLSAINKARAVILPQGCSRKLFEMAHEHCVHVFPDYRARFEYPGKIGQIRLFREQGVRHPQTYTFHSLGCFDHIDADGCPTIPLTMPFVAKFDWGGEGLNVHLIQSCSDFKRFLDKAARFEQTGQKGFLLQEYIPASNRSLRAVVIGRTIITYWRIQTDPACFASNVSQGATINREVDPDLQRLGADTVKGFSHRSGIDLAGYDLLFSDIGEAVVPYFLEINYFFGRGGLGGSKAFYRILDDEIRDWIDSLDD